MENPRTTAARDHDDSAIIDDAVSQGSGGDAGRAGGALAQGVGTQDELVRGAADPDAHTRAAKQDDMHAGQARPSGHRGNNA